MVLSVLFPLTRATSSGWKIPSSENRAKSWCLEGRRQRERLSDQAWNNSIMMAVGLL